MDADVDIKQNTNRTKKLLMQRRYMKKRWLYFRGDRHYWGRQEVHSASHQKPALTTINWILYFNFVALTFIVVYIKTKKELKYVSLANISVSTHQLQAGLSLQIFLENKIQKYGFLVIKPPN